MCMYVCMCGEVGICFALRSLRVRVHAHALQRNTFSLVQVFEAHVRNFGCVNGLHLSLVLVPQKNR
jgi:hypothetical protein